MNLKEGEYICDKCNGRGSLPTRNPDVVRQCPKCLGKKKVDWIENIIGVTKPKESGIDILKEYSRIAGQILSNKIDEDITKSLTDNDNTFSIPRGK